MCKCPEIDLSILFSVILEISDLVLLWQTFLENIFKILFASLKKWPANLLIKYHRTIIRPTLEFSQFV